MTVSSRPASSEAPLAPGLPANSPSSSDHARSRSDAAERVVLDDQAIRRTLMRIAHEIVESADGLQRLYLIAIPNGGVPLGRILVDNLESLTGERVPLGILDTTLYRDDLATRGSRPQLRRTEMPSSVDDRVVVLVEDVVSTGRTIRAAMDALMDFGRPSHVRVVALVDRGHRELPIKIDYVGKNIPTQSEDKVIFDAGRVVAEDEDESASGTAALRLIVRKGGAEAATEGSASMPRSEVQEAGA